MTRRDACERLDRGRESGFMQGVKAVGLALLIIGALIVLFAKAPFASAMRKDEHAPLPPGRKK